MTWYNRFLRDQGTPPPSKAKSRVARRGAPDAQSANNNDSLVVGGIVCSAVIALAVMMLISTIVRGDVRVDPTTLCPLEVRNIPSKTYIHIDLSEPLVGEQRQWLQDLLGVAVAEDSSIEKYSYFSISQMQTVPIAPRVQVEVFCIPDTRGINAAGKRVTKADCEEIAEDEFDWEEKRNLRHVGGALKKEITQSCKSFVSLKERVHGTANRYKKVQFGQSRSYIVGGIEDVMHASDFEDKPRLPARLIMFSDMLQNAKWFSQYKTLADDWSAKGLKKLRKSDAAIKEMGGKPPPSSWKFNKVLLCYLPSAHHILASARNQKAHRKMWREYFHNKVYRANDFAEVNASACAEAAKQLMEEE